MGMSAFGVEDGRIAKAYSSGEETVAGGTVGGAALGASQLRRSAQLRPTIRANDQKAAAAWKLHRPTEAINYTVKAEHAASGAKTLMRSGLKRSAVGTGVGALGVGLYAHGKDRVAKASAHRVMSAKAGKVTPMCVLQST